MRLSRFPRVALAHLPTPLETLPALARHLGGPRLLVKRDDLTGLAGGGNKTRKLEFLMADALAHGADTVVTGGGVQSNHARQTAAAAAKLGLKCELVLQRSVPWDEPGYEETGNALLDRLLGATVHTVPSEADRAAEMERVADDVRGRGGAPYVIPGGGSNALGALGYAACALELIDQAAAQDVSVDYVVLASGTGGTQGGLVAGLAGADSGIAVIGIDIDAAPAEVEANVRRIAAETARKLGAGRAAGSVTVKGGYAGEAYGLPTPEMAAAVTLLARLEGLVLDPVYTGKAMAGLIDLVGAGFFRPTDTVVFLHTGGAPALFAYASVFAGG